MTGWRALLWVGVLCAGCGGGGSSAAGPSQPDDGLPESIGAEDCGGCRLTGGQCSAFFSVDSEGGEQVQGKEVPCDASCCAGPPAADG